MDKKVCVITGATNGIGLETAKALAGLGFCVIMACRNMQKAEKLSNKIACDTNNSSIYPMTLDLASFESIDNFARKFTTNFNRLDILINNAGTICNRHYKTEQGFEMTMGVNYLGTYYLTEQLLPKIISTKQSRIINVSSIVGINSKMREEILDFYNIKHGLNAYTASKLALILYTKDLAERIKEQGTTANAVHPGIVGTNIWSGEGLFMKITNPLMKLFFPSPQKGAENLIYMAVSPDTAGINGCMFNKRNKANGKRSANDILLQKKLIDKTQKIIDTVHSK